MEFEISPDQAAELAAADKILKADWYMYVVDDLQDKTSEKGNAMVLCRAKGIEGEAKGVTVFFNILPSFAPIFNGFLNAMGGKLDPRATTKQKFKFDNASCKGKRFRAYTRPGEYEGTPKNEITAVLPENAPIPPSPKKDKAAAGTPAPAGKAPQQ